MLTLILSIVLGVLLILIVLLFMYSPGKPEPFLDRNGKVLEGSISEKTFVTIGGIRQGMFIKSKNQENPVLLYLHGGIPDYFLTRKYPTGLEDYFTVVWWEQRGSGLSYSANIPAETMNLGSNDIRHERGNKLPAYPFWAGKDLPHGSFGGNFLGIQAAARAPELYHAYIGIGQMSDQLKSERLAYEYMLKQYREIGNRKMAQKLEASPVTDDIPYGYLKLRDQAMHSLGIGTTRDMNSVITGMFIPSLTCKEYTLKEKFNLWRGKSQSGVHPFGMR